MKIQKRLAPKEMGVTNEIFEVMASEVDSNGATAGDVLTADGAGGSSWQPGDDSDWVQVGDGWSLLGGGDDRGLGAVDLQYTRANDAQVASGDYSVIGGGRYNTVSGENSVIGGGYGNTVVGMDSFIGGGLLNICSEPYTGKSVISGGYYNHNYGTMSAISSGMENLISGAQFAFIGSGSSNKCYADSSAIGAGNQNYIAVSGQGGFIGGGQRNKINNNQYAVIVGGRNNEVYGDSSSCSAILGGDYNYIYGSADAILGGVDNSIGDESSYSSIICGKNNTVNDSNGSFVSGLANSIVNSNNSAIVGGQNAYMNGGNSTVFVGAPSGSLLGGGSNVALAGGGVLNAAQSVTIGPSRTDILGQLALTSAAFSFANKGDAQTSFVVAVRETEDATPSQLWVGGDMYEEDLLIPTGTTWAFDILVAARREDADNESAGYHFLGVIDNNAGTTALVGAVAKTVIAEDDADWDCNVTADDVDDALVITVTGEAGKTIRWVARVNLVHVKG